MLADLQRSVGTRKEVGWSGEWVVAYDVSPSSVPPVPRARYSGYQDWGRPVSADYFGPFTLQLQVQRRWQTVCTRAHKRAPLVNCWTPQ